MGEATLIATVAGEPDERLRAMIDGAAAQVPVVPPLVIACPPADAERVQRIASSSRVSTVVVPNPSGARSAGLNLAARAAATPIVIRVDARSRLAPEHVVRCVQRLQEPMIGVVGGHQVPVASTVGTMSRGIVRALANPNLLGAPKYRRPDASGEADTVYLGAFRRDELLATGGWDERLAANEDFELCRRYQAQGRKVWLEKDLHVGYEPRETIASLFDQYHQFGLAKVDFWRVTGARPNTRQALAVAGALVAGVALSTRRTRLPSLIVGGVALGTLDTLGRPRDPLLVRAVAIAASAAALTGWISGIALGLLRQGQT